MSSFKLEQFGGMLPAWDDHLIPAGQSASCFNAYLFSGALIGWRTPKFLRTLTNPAAKSAFRIPTIINGAFQNAIAGPATWLEFLDPFTDVMRTQVVNDAFERYYFASPSQTPQYNTLARIQAGQPAFQLGIEAPGCAAGVTVTGGGNAVQLGFVNSFSTLTAGVTGNTLYFIPVKPNGALSLNTISIVPQDTIPTATFVAGLYDDVNGAPFQLLAASDPTVGCTAGTEVDCNFSNPPGLAANVQYWLAIMSDTALDIQVADSNTTAVIQNGVTFSNGPPLFTHGLVSNQPDLQVWGTFSTSDIIEARAYVYTWVSAYGEEGPPSPPALVNGWSNGVWTVGLFSPPAAELGTTKNIVTTRIYRTVTASGGGATYYWVADVPVGTASYIDIQPDNLIALNNIIESVLYFPPPSDLQGILAMPNGMAVGFRKNEIWFCEPYRPHAWPPSYVVTTEFNIVGLGVTGNAVVAATEGSPYILQGVIPGQMVAYKTTLYEPCLSRGSILATDTAVFYSSANGLIEVSPATNQAFNTSEPWITRDRWAALTPHQNIKAIRLAQMYFAFEMGAQDGFALDMSQDNQSFTIWPQPGGHRIGFTGLTAPIGNVDNLQVDTWTGIGLMISGGNLYYYDFTDAAPLIQPTTWRSKIYQQLTKKNFEAMKIYFTIPPNTPAQNATRNTAPHSDPSWNTLQTGQYGIVRVFADGQLVTAREIVSSGELLRIESGFKAEEWQWEFTTRIHISNMQAATSAKELAGV